MRLCADCHALEAFAGWRREGGPDSGKWIVMAQPKSAQLS
jgi:hypothetical protein